MGHLSGGSWEKKRKRNNIPLPCSLRDSQNQKCICSVKKVQQTCRMPLTRPTSVPGIRRASRSCSCSWQRSHGTEDSFFCNTISRKVTKLSCTHPSHPLVTPTPLRPSKKESRICNSTAPTNHYLWKVTCFGLTCRFFTSTLLPHSTIGMFSHTLQPKIQLKPIWNAE